MLFRKSLLESKYAKVTGMWFLLAVLAFILSSPGVFGAEIIIDVPENTTIGDATPDLNVSFNESINVTYIWDNEGNITGCRECNVYNTTYGENNGSDENLVALWHFNENYWNATYDDSGSGNDGTLGNGTTGTEPIWTTGWFGPALEFDRVDDCVDTGNDSSLNAPAGSSLTISAWVYPSSGSAGQWRIIVDKSNQNIPEVNYRIWLGASGWADKFGLSYYSGGGWRIANTTDSVPTDTWTHVALVTWWDGSNRHVKLYINGVLNGGDQTIGFDFVTNGYNGSIGCRLYNPPGNNNFNGTIDEAAIYNRSLSGSEILEMYGKSLKDGSHCVTVYANDSTGSLNSTKKCFTVSASAPETVRVTTNRYVILDEPDTSGTISFGYPNPSNDWAAYSYWTGEATTIRAYALVMDDDGVALSNVDVNFTLINPGGTVVNYSVVSTGADGQASYYFDLNNQDHWGKWTINASVSEGSISIHRSTEFVYNWWGCGNCHAGGGHNPTLYSVSPPNNPYLPGYDRVHTISMGMGGAHSNIMDNNNCLRCHQSYGSGSAGSQYPVGYHNNQKTCQSCHGTGNNIRGTYNGVPDMPSCYGAGCHSIKNTNLTSVSTLDPSLPNDARGNPRTRYSDNPPPAASGNPLKNHTSSKVSCVLCHGPMHNITKPDPSPANSNTYTEDSQCKTCHSPRTEHNNQVKCTTCHSQDVHNIRYFDTTGNYVNNQGNAGNCTTCHQQTAAWNTLLTQPKVGSYSGSGPPQIPVPLNHSNNATAGQRWGNYWTSGDDLSACNYCHGDTKHSAAALGRPANWKGSNTVNSSINSANTWCAGCHYQGYGSGSDSYANMTSKFAGDGLKVPPEITGHSTYAPSGTSGYFNHSLGNYSDRVCSYCHDGLAESAANVSPLLHNIGMGKKCENCHFSFSKMNGTFDRPTKYMNETQFTKSVHGSSSVFPSVIFCTSCHTVIRNATNFHLSMDPGKFTPPESGWRWCEDCHVVNQSMSDPNRHNLTDSPQTNMFNSTTSVMDVTGCTTCHNTTRYNNAIATYNRSSGKDCRFCHSFPDFDPDSPY